MSEQAKPVRMWRDKRDGELFSYTPTNLGSGSNFEPVDVVITPAREPLKFTREIVVDCVGMRNISLASRVFPMCWWSDQHNRPLGGKGKRFRVTFEEVEL